MLLMVQRSANYYASYPFITLTWCWVSEPSYKPSLSCVSYSTPLKKRIKLQNSLLQHPKKHPTNTWILDSPEPGVHKAEHKRHGLLSAWRRPAQSAWCRAGILDSPRFAFSFRNFNVQFLAFFMGKMSMLLVLINCMSHWFVGLWKVENCLRFVSSRCVMMVFVMEFLRSNMSRSYLVFLFSFCVLGFWSSSRDYMYILHTSIYLYIHIKYIHTKFSSSATKKDPKGENSSTWAILF